MNDATLEGFRQIAAAMQTEPCDWQWIGQHLSQRHFGITEKRAKEFAARHGGEAKLMTPVADPFADYADIQSNDGHADERRRASILVL